MRSHHKQLTADNRAVFESLLSDGLSLRAIDARIGVGTSTICRERSRGLFPELDRYLALLGQSVRQAARAQAVRVRRTLGTDALLYRLAYCPATAQAGLSPQQNASRLRGMPDALSTSHETIYAAIYAMLRGALRSELVLTLRKSHAGRLPRTRGSSRFTGVQNITPIGLRPPEVDQRLASGHWKADLIKGCRNGAAILTLIKRTSRYISLAKLDSCDAESVP